MQEALSQVVTEECRALLLSMEGTAASREKERLTKIILEKDGDLVMVREDLLRQLKQMPTQNSGRSPHPRRRHRLRKYAAR